MAVRITGGGKSPLKARLRAKPSNTSRGVRFPAGSQANDQGSVKLGTKTLKGTPGYLGREP